MQRSNATVAAMSSALRIDRCRVRAFPKLRAQNIVRLDGGFVGASIVTDWATDNHESPLRIFFTRLAGFLTGTSSAFLRPSVKPREYSSAKS